MVTGVGCFGPVSSDEGTQMTTKTLDLEGTRYTICVVVWEANLMTLGWRYWFSDALHFANLRRLRLRSTGIRWVGFTGVK